METWKDRQKCKIELNKLLRHCLLYAQVTIVLSIGLLAFNACIEWRV